MNDEVSNGTREVEALFFDDVVDTHDFSRVSLISVCNK
jgi:hypothetical protein